MEQVKEMNNIKNIGRYFVFGTDPDRNGALEETHRS
jgi:hypothetical protein